MAGKNVFDHHDFKDDQDVADYCEVWDFRERWLHEAMYGGPYLDAENARDTALLHKRMRERGQ